MKGGHGQTNQVSYMTLIWVLLTMHIMCPNLQWCVQGGAKDDQATPRRRTTYTVCSYADTKLIYTARSILLTQLMSQTIGWIKSTMLSFMIAT